MTRVVATLLFTVLVASCGGATMSSAPASTPSAAVVTSVAPSARPTKTALPTPRPSTGDPVVDARVADLAYLVQRLRMVHPNEFLDEGEAAFMARVAAIEEKAGSLSDVGFLLAVMDLMGHRDRDGHTGAWAFAQPGSLLKAWPVWLYDFPDGLRVVAARAPNEDLVGARVTKVGHATVAAARSAVDRLVPRDNPSNLRSNLGTYLTLPDVLGELGLLDTGDWGLTLAMPDGSTREVTPDAIPVEAMRDWIFGVYGGHYPEYLPPDADGPLVLRNHDLAFWSTPLSEPAGTYVGYNDVMRNASDGNTIAALATTVLEAAETNPGAPIVVDLRNNGGGDNTTFRPFREALERIAAKHPGSVRLIAGRATFSAAGNFVTDLKVGPQKDGITLVGEPPGGGLNIYGDVKVVTLPASRIVVLIAGVYHERSRDDDRLQIEPDVPIELTWADYAAGRDPVLGVARTP